MDTSARHLAQTWVRLWEIVGIADIPISVHVFFHFPQIIRRYGAPALYAVNLDETNHKNDRLAATNNTTHQVGESGDDYVKEILRRIARRTVFKHFGERYKLNHEARPCFSTVLKCHPSQFLRSSRAHRDNVVRLSLARVRRVFNLENRVNFEISDANMDCYPAVDVEVQNEHNRTVIHAKRIHCWGNSKSASDLRVMAISPILGEEYFRRRQEFFERLGSCNKKNSCFACSQTEFTSTTAVNMDEFLCDEFIIPLGFIALSQMEVEVLALPLRCCKRTEARCIVEIDESRPIQRISMLRFRDTCNFYHFETSSESESIVLSRMRGKM
jgi:hypothetical protein